MLSFGQLGFTTNRREWIRLGGLGALGLSLPDLLATNAPSGGKKFGRAKSCIILFLGGGPPQHETFDPKPAAPLEIRGDFKPIGTSVPGMHFCELLPRVAKAANKLTIIRSMHSDINNHAISGYWMMTGRQHKSPGDVPASPDDWPSIASVVGQLQPSRRSPLSSVVLPERVVNNPGIPWPGQNGGFMGRTWDPFLFQCEPNAPDFRVDELSLTEDVPLARMSGRAGLLDQLDRQLQSQTKGDALAGLTRARKQAMGVLTSGPTRRAFELDREPDSIRDAYGRHKFGQSVLLARRLIEAGTRLVQVNFPREPGDLSSPNPLWDTHRKNSDRLKQNLCPPFDLAFSTLLEDLQRRGLLDETLLVVMGEFGRTPKINKYGGRDHWGSCYSVALAGGGVPGGQIIGSSDDHAAYPKSRPLRPPDLAATIFHLLGISHHAEFKDRLDRPLPVVDGGNPIKEIVGG